MFSLDAWYGLAARPVVITKVVEHATRAGYSSTMPVRRVPGLLLAPLVFAATSPGVAQAAAAFGQDDDVTVLTLARLGQGEASTTRFSAPVFEPAG